MSSFHANSRRGENGRRGGLKNRFRAGCIPSQPIEGSMPSAGTISMTLLRCMRRSFAEGVP